MVPVTVRVGPLAWSVQFVAATSGPTGLLLYQWKALVSGSAVVLTAFHLVLFVVYCLSCTVCRVLFVVYCLLCTVCCVLFVVYCLLCTVCCVLFVVYCLLCAVCCVLFVVYCLLCAVCCVLFVVCRLLQAMGQFVMMCASQGL